MNWVRILAIWTCAFAAFLPVSAARAQTDPVKFEVGVNFTSMQQRAFSETDAGFGGRFAFYPMPNVAAEAEVNYFPGSLGNTVAFSRFRSQARFGIKAGGRMGNLGVFAKIRPGFVRFAEAPGGIVCIAILIYPPPLECSISAGRTNFALDLGGGVEFFHLRRTVIRFDFGDTMIRFDGPAYAGGKRFMKDFSVHNFQFTAGFGIRF